MKIICDSCNTKYSIADNKLKKGKVFKIKCKKCGNSIVVKPVEEAPPEDDATRVVDVSGLNESVQASASAGPAKEWLVVLGKDQKGPFTIEEIKAKIDSGEVNADTFSWKEGLADWVKISTIEQFTAFFDSSESSAAAPSAAPAAESAPSAEADPFAAFDSGPEESKEPAPSMKGQRHDNSVLFSLENLQNLASTKKPKPGYTVPTRSESDLADIQSMGGGSSSPSLDLSAPSVVATPMVSAPMLSIQDDDDDEGKNKILLFGGIGVGVLAILVLMFFVMKSMMGGPKGDDSKKPVQVANNMGSMDSMDSMKKDTMKVADATKVVVNMKVNADTMKVVDATKVADSMVPDDSMKKDPVKDPKNTMRNTTMRNTTMRNTTMRNTTMRNTMKTVMTPAMTSGCTKVWCMLKNNGPSCCKKWTGGSTMKSGGDPCANNPNANLTTSQIRSGMGKVRGRVKGCFNKYGIHGKVKVRITVGCNGRVKGASAKGSHSGTPLGRCIQNAVRRAKFPKFKKKSRSFTYPFIG
jgi:predicted Zn finger-like uncharacterized protein